MKRECFLIINPVSGGYSKKKLDLIINRLSGKYDIKVLITAKAGDAGEFSRKICDVSEHPLIAVGGGDGTVNEVINGIMKVHGLQFTVHSSPVNQEMQKKNFGVELGIPTSSLVPHPSSFSSTLAVIPFGTANVLAKELGIYTVDEAIQKLLRGEEKTVSLGVIEKIDSRNNDQEEKSNSATGSSASSIVSRPSSIIFPSPRYFILMAGIGFDGALVERVKFKGYGLFKKLAYVFAGIRELFSMDKEMITLVADGKEYVCHSAFICNVTKYAGNFILAPETDISEPLFQVICIKNPGPFAYLKFLSALLCQSHLRQKDILSFKASTVEIQSVKPVQIDGEFYGDSPAKISAVKSGIKIIS